MLARSDDAKDGQGGAAQVPPRPRGSAQDKGAAPRPPRPFPRLERLVLGLSRCAPLRSRPPLDLFSSRRWEVLVTLGASRNWGLPVSSSTLSFGLGAPRTQ